MKKSRIFITGDCHGSDSIMKLGSKGFKIGKTLTKNDFVVILGDFGVLWNLIETRDERYWLKWLDEKPFTTLFVDGNHENFERLNRLETTHFLDGKVGIVSNSIFHLRRGEIYTINEQTFFSFGGAKSYDKSSRIENLSWWSQEECNHAETEYAITNLEKHNNKVDVILTHTIPETFAIENKFIHSIDSAYRSDPCSVRLFLDHVVKTVEFKRFYAGHFHVDTTIDKYSMLYDEIVELD